MAKRKSFQYVPAGALTGLQQGTSGVDAERREEFGKLPLADFPDLGVQTPLKKTFEEFDENDVMRAVACWEAKLIASTFISQAREHSKLSQARLAKALGCHKSYVTQAESMTAETKVPLDFLLRVSYATSYPFLITDAASICASHNSVSPAVRSQEINSLLSKVPLRK